MKEDQDKRLRRLETLEIPDSDDEALFELQQISEIFFASGLRDISRVNQEKQVELRYQYNEDVYDSNDLLDYARSEIEDVIQGCQHPCRCCRGAGAGRHRTGMNSNTCS
jgi:multidrug efflux pump subunit AcrB